MKKQFYLLIILSIGIFWSLPLQSAMTGGDYEIFADTFSVIQDQYSTSTDYGLFGTAGEYFATNTTGGVFAVRGGFQAMERGALSLTLSSDSLNLGQLSPTAVKKATLTMLVTTESETGYTVTAREDDDLRTAGGFEISDVLDGTVTTGTEEYGARTVGGGGQLANDTGFDNDDDLTIASSNGVVTNQETALVFRAAMHEDDTRAGNYSHTITFSIIANP